MRNILIPKPFAWAHERAPKETHRTVTFQIWVRDVIEGTADFGKWPNTLKAMEILKAIDGVPEGMAAKLEEEDYKALKKALAITLHPAYSIALAEAGFYQAIEDARKE